MVLRDFFTPPSKTLENPFINSFNKLRRAISHPGFWILAITFFICGLTSNGLVTQHFIPFCADNNVGIIAASSYLALMGVFNFLGTTGSGWLSDRFNNFNLLATYYGFRGVSLLYLPYSSFDVLSLEFVGIVFWIRFHCNRSSNSQIVWQILWACGWPHYFWMDFCFPPTRRSSCCIWCRRKQRCSFDL